MTTLLTKEVMGLAILTFSVVFLFKWQIQPIFTEVMALNEQCHEMQLEDQLQDVELLPILEARLKRAQMVRTKLRKPEQVKDSSGFSKQIDNLVLETGVQLWSFKQEDSQLWRLQLRGLSRELTLFLHHFEASPYCQVIEQCELDVSPEMNMNLLFRTNNELTKEALK